MMQLLGTVTLWIAGIIAFLCVVSIANSLTIIAEVIQGIEVKTEDSDG